ncbi:hypothetical protein Vadar_033081 [Vaccinium darrowii]|uniref:Uncharacterized protein n=1 Tax=Vaccinium darrowii TaxID=229202 RepID=A0ACB7Y3R4_9ERIC|nr:hypothetical protein Vadar_033081 [Vaccinium darrowii]
MFLHNFASSFHTSQEKVPIPSFAFDWLDEKDKFSAGDVATIKVIVLRNYERDKYGYGFNPNVTVNGNMNIQASLDGMIEENPGVYESENMEIDDDGSILEGGKSFSVPCFLNKVFTKEVGEGGW